MLQVSALSQGIIRRINKISSKGGYDFSTNSLIFAVGLNFTKGTKRGKIKNRPYKTEFNTTIIELN